MRKQKTNISKGCPLKNPSVPCGLQRRNKDYVFNILVCRSRKKGDGSAKIRWTTAPLKP